MKDGTLDLDAPLDTKASHALAFFLRAIAAGAFIWLSLHGLAAVRWW